MIARWSDEEPGGSLAAQSLRRARRAVAEALLPTPPPPTVVERPSVSLSGAWLVAGWGLLVVVAYLARVSAWWAGAG